MRILIVEDNLLTRLMIERSLKKWGYDVITVDNIHVAITIITSERIQFVITDWIMPGGNGTLLCHNIRALNLPFYTYIILVTYLDDAKSVVQGMDSGADDFIRKPIQLDELQARIKAGERVLNLEKELQENNLRLQELSNALIAANDVINRDLKMAATMQQSLLPSVATEIQGIAIDWLFYPSTYLSGDIFNFFSLDDCHVGFYIIDVAGHGIASAMQSFTLSRLLYPNSQGNDLLRIISSESPRHYSIRSASEVIADLNQQFQTDANNILYFTMVYGVIDTNAKQIDLCQAGHPHPLLVQVGQSAEFLESGGLPVGVLDIASYESVKLSYADGDRLFLYSDGIAECESPEGAMFGNNRLRQFVDDTRRLDASDVMSELDKAIHCWHGSNDFEDDISMLVLQLG